MKEQLLAVIANLKNTNTNSPEALSVLNTCEQILNNPQAKEEEYALVSSTLEMFNTEDSEEFTQNDIDPLLDKIEEPVIEDATPIIIPEEEKIIIGDEIKNEIPVSEEPVIEEGNVNFIENPINTNELNEVLSINPNEALRIDEN